MCVGPEEKCRVVCGTLAPRLKALAEAVSCNAERDILPEDIRKYLINSFISVSFCIKNRAVVPFKNRTHCEFPSLKTKT